MKEKEQIEAAIKKYKQMLEDNQRIMNFEDDFLQASVFMDDKNTYTDSVRKRHEAELVVYACEKLIKNCRWILDIE